MSLKCGLLPLILVVPGTSCQIFEAYQRRMSCGVPLQATFSEAGCSTGAGASGLWLGNWAYNLPDIVCACAGAGATICEQLLAQGVKWILDSTNQPQMGAFGTSRHRFERCNECDIHACWTVLRYASDFLIRCSSLYSERAALDVLLLTDCIWKRLGRRVQIWQLF